ncbi:MAG: aldehyde dehydrogenase [Caulobacterales bacterium 68-7]|nr:MAG: aldehyde dehydrogenase [Caulobacterales bacterium 68-7]
MSAYPKLVANQIAGAEQAASGGATVDILSPHNGSVIGQLARSTAADVDAAVASAKAAQAAWAATPGVARGHVLHKIANLIEARAEELAALVALEAGKRLGDSLGEVGAAVQCARFFAGEGQRLFGRTMTSGTPHRWAMTLRRPCGVAALIVAANTPAPNFAWKVFPALICGNGIVLKPAEDTPASAWWLAKICEEAGLPKGLLNVVHGLGAEVGPALTGHPDVDVISFTGSTRVGRQIAETAGKDLKKVSLELGGKNAFVVCDDADLDNAVTWAKLAAFSNAGQRCAAGSRILVFDAVYDAFVEKFVASSKTLKVGVEADCDLGPVINARQLANMTATVERAVAAGAKVLLGGGRATDPALAGGFYMQPTVLEGAGPDSELWSEELFGPIPLIQRVAGFEEALALANSSPYGLTCAIHTRNIDRALTFVARMHTGVAVINAGTHGSEPHMPFGGTKASGNGTREPGTEALDVYSELQDVYVNVRPDQV